MPTIDTELDPRFSAPGASPTSWERTRRASHVYEVVPSKVLAFAKAPAGRTRHRFLDDRSAPS